MVLTRSTGSLELNPVALLTALSDRPWAILPSTLSSMRDFALSYLTHGAVALPGGEAGAVVPQAAVASPAGQAGTAVIPIHGALMQRPGFFEQLFLGVSSTDAIGQQFRAAMADPAVKQIVLHVDSPGGEVFGIDELASEIRAGAKQKTVTAICDPLMASAAYYLASGASEIVVTPSGLIGSIGVIAQHNDLSGALEQAGIKPTLITAGKYKGEGNPYGPLSDEDKAAMQSRIDDYYGMFTRAVAAGRGVSVADVRAGYGEGRVVGSRDAVKSGLADRIGTWQQMAAQIGGPNARISFAGAGLDIEAEEDAPTPDDLTPPAPAGEEDEEPTTESFSSIAAAVAARAQEAWA